MKDKNLKQLNKNDYIIIGDKELARVVVMSSVALIIYDLTEKRMGVCTYDSPVHGQLLVSDMLKELKQQNCKDLHAAVYGGASLSKNKAITQNIGTRNYEFAKYFLSYYKVSLYKESVGGDQGRTLTFSLSKDSVVIEEKFHVGDPNA